jgi:ABC-type transport system involved in multi-copper enzyme maturation permease subunit
MNPILRRDLLEILRSRKALAFEFGLSLICIFLVLLRWPTGNLADLSGARSIQVLRIFGFGLLSGILVLVPAFPATSLVREKIRGTLALLLNSPLKPASIYLGKLGAVLGFTLILLIMTLPAAAACYALGGSAFNGGISLLYVILVVAALQMASVAMLVSSRSNSTDGALRVTYAIVLALCILPMAPYALLQGGSLPLVDASSWLRCLSPIPPTMEVLGQVDVGLHGMATGSSTISRYLLLAPFMSLICAFLTISRLNFSMLDRARAAGIMTQDRTTGQRVARRLFFLVDPQRRSSSNSLLVNPVLTKEFRTRRFGRSQWILRLIAVCAILSLGLTYLALSNAIGWGIEYIGAGLVLLQIALLILFAPSLGAGIISSEMESRSWQLLRMTPLSSGAILRGKLLSIVWPLILLLCATIPGYVVMMTIEPSLIPRVERVVACLIITALFVVLVSATASSVFRSTAAALTASYVILMVICFVPLLIWLGREAPFGHSLVQAALIIDPVAMALQASDAPGFEPYELRPANWWIIGITSAILLVILRIRVWQLSRPD